ncbi:MAG TPA: flagellar protein FlgN [Paenibacillus sp.]|jgi:flagellar biosynthesis/type III secretory pathway chaperone
MALNKLIQAMEQLDTAHHHMLEIAESKRVTIMNNDVERLITILNQESKVMKQIEQLEQIRVSASYELLQEKGIKSLLNLTVTELVRLVFDPEDKRKLLDVQSRLSHTLAQVQEINQLNQKLIEQSLAFIDYSLDVLIDRPTQEATYQHPSDKHNGQGWPGLFDTRA